MTRRTALGGALTGLALLGMAAGLLVGSLAPALGGLVLLGSIESARRHVSRQPVAVRRTVPRRAALGRPFAVVLEADAPGWGIELSDILPTGVHARSQARASGTGSARLEYQAEATAIGSVQWGRIRLRVGDPWGLWHIEHAVSPAPATTEVGPEPEWAATGRRIGRQRTVQTTRRARRAFEPQPDVEVIRQAEPFDRARDIDWPRSLRSDTLQIRQRERAAARRIIVLVDAQHSMRMERGVAKITTAARLVAGIGSAARGAGVASHVVVYHEGGAQSTPELSVGFMDILRGLARLPAAAPATAVRLVDDTPRTPTGHERRFLQTVAPFAKGPSPGRPPFEAALSLLLREDPAFVVAILDVEVRPLHAEVMARRLRAKGHDVVVVAPGTGAHHASRAEAAGMLPVLEEAYLRRERVRKHLAGHRVDLLVATPRNVKEMIGEVARRAR